MHIRHKKVKSDFLAVDLNELVRRHYDLLQSYQDAWDKVRAPSLRRVFDSVIRGHERATESLAELADRHYQNGSDGSNADAVPARMRVIFGQLLSDGAVVRAMLANEQKLLQMYTATIKTMTYLPELEQVLISNRLDAQKRIARLELVIGLDG